MGELRPHHPDDPRITGCAFVVVLEPGMLSRRLTLPVFSALAVTIHDAEQRMHRPAFRRAGEGFVKKRTHTASLLHLSAYQLALLTPHPSRAEKLGPPS